MDRKARKEMAIAPGAQPVPRTFGYGEIETFLAKMYDAEDVQRSRFRSRVQHFRKCGLPQKRVGKGARVRYSSSDVFQLVLAFEFAEFGVDPQLIIDIIRRHWRRQSGLWEAVSLAQQALAEKSSFELHVVVKAHMMSWTWNREKFKQTATENSVSTVSEPIAIQYFWASKSPPASAKLPPGFPTTNTFLEWLEKPGTRCFVFNLSERVRAVEQALTEEK
jgi:hypothetical protein